MIYVLQFRGWIKVGFTKQEWYKRAGKGFWTNKHPTELCGLLDEFTVIAGFDIDDINIEQILHKELFYGAVGEFYKEEALPEILTFLRTIGEEIQLEQAYRTRPKFMMSCCSGHVFECKSCIKTFTRKDKFFNHCKRCGK